LPRQGISRQCRRQDRAQTSEHGAMLSANEERRNELLRRSHVNLETELTSIRATDDSEQGCIRSGSGKR
jgi:hypothetical protein